MCGYTDTETQASTQSKPAERKHKHTRSRYCGNKGEFKSFCCFLQTKTNNTVFLKPVLPGYKVHLCNASLCLVVFIPVLVWTHTHIHKDMDSPFITLLKRLQQPQKASNNTSVVCCAASALSIFLPEREIFEGHDMFEHI